MPYSIICSKFVDIFLLSLQKNRNKCICRCRNKTLHINVKSSSNFLLNKFFRNKTTLSWPHDTGCQRVNFTLTFYFEKNIKNSISHQSSILVTMHLKKYFYFSIFLCKIWFLGKTKKNPHQFLFSVQFFCPCPPHFAKSL